MHESWLAVLGDELDQTYMTELRSFLLAEVEAGRRFYPPADRVFNALALTPFDDVRVVILGQDPYHGAGQAMGLCFSVPAGVRPPPSLQNIHAELEADLGLGRPTTGDLTPWAERGVLLLNAVLTVSPGKPASHAGKGWSASPIVRSASSRSAATASCSSSGGATPSRRAPSSTRPATTSSPRRTPPPTAPRAGSSAAVTSRARTRFSTPAETNLSTGRSRETGPCAVGQADCSITLSSSPRSQMRGLPSSTDVTCAQRRARTQ